MSVWDVSCLWVGIFLAAPFPGSAPLPSCPDTRLSACLPFLQVHSLLGGRMHQGAAWRWHCSHLPAKLKERNHQLAPRAANRPKTHRGQLSLVNSDPERILQHASGRVPQCPPAEPQTWKDFRVNFNNTGQLPLPLYGHESGYVPPSCPALCVAKFRSGNSFTSQSPLTVSSLLGLAFQYEAKTNNQRNFIYL